MSQDEKKVKRKSNSAVCLHFFLFKKRRGGYVNNVQLMIHITNMVELLTKKVSITKLAVREKSHSDYIFFFHN